MKRYIKSTTSWNNLSPSEQLAVEYARQAYEGGGYDLDEAVERGCHRVAWGNAEPEYEDEDFYMDEPEESNVLNYLLDDYKKSGQAVRRSPIIKDRAIKTYINECLQHEPNMPDGSPEDKPEAWSAYWRDIKEYKTWAFVDAVEDGVCSEEDADRFYDLWDKMSSAMADAWA